NLGGRAGSFTDTQTGQVLDRGQHITLGCCTYLTDLLRMLGAQEQIEYSREFFFRSEGGVTDSLTPSRLPAPMHFAPSFVRMRQFSMSDKLRIGWAMLRILRTPPASADHETFGRLLRRWGQPERLMRRFWNVFVVSACNLDVDTVGARYAVQVFRDGLLAGASAAAMGVPVVPLAALFGRAEDVITAAGGGVQFSVRAKQIHTADEQVICIETNRGMMQAGVYITAVPHRQLARLGGDALRTTDDRFKHLGEIGTSPIVGVHLWFDRQITAHPHLALLDRETQWVFNKGIDADGRQHILAVISGAHGWLAKPKTEIAAIVLDDLRTVLPEAQCIAWRVVKERHATFAPVPHVEAKRPTTTGEIGNLFVAGDFCRVGWPATMEAAVRSGYLAADAVTGERSGDSPGDLPRGWLVRLLMSGAM
ncbi:MAG: hydroxysqualene dehydroxylase HpnE, partial [Phycisphaerales bacterium]|nr:hydroxysqualene dehydroxylase HpnE [Phycisphaerales bacterium]